MNEQSSSGGVSYKQVGADYFEKRGLKRYAKVWSLWALGVGAVISGHYSGWNLGMTNGFGSMLVALFIIAAMYWGLIFSLAEMSPALPHTGAAYSFARSAMGPWGGMFTGLAESIEYVLTPAVIVFFIGSYMTAIFNTPPEWQPAWWAASYIVFLLLNLFGVELSFRVSVIVTVAALLILAVFWVSAIPSIDFERWALNIGIGADGSRVELPEGGGSWFPLGFKGVLMTLPFAVWLFLAIEQLPLAAEESADPKKDMPKGLILGMLTLMLSALLITFLNSSVGSMDEGKMHGAFTLAASGEPLLDGFRVLYGNTWAKLLSFLAVIGLIASFHTIIYAYGRQIYSLARAGYYLPFMSLTNVKKVPHMALFAGTILGFSTMMILWFLAAKGDTTKSTAIIGGTLLNMAVFGAMISYAMQGLSFIVLRNKMPNIVRPYRSPVGVPGAFVTIVVALVTIYFQLQDPVYRGAVYYVAGFYVLGILYFAAYGRHQLILSPEEEFALSKGEKGHA